MQLHAHSRPHIHARAHTHTRTGDKGLDRPRSMLKICTLPKDVEVDSYWPVRTRHIGCTVHHMTYHPPTGCVVLITSVLEDMDEERKAEGSLEGHLPPLMEERYEMKLLAPYTMDVIDTHPFDYQNGEQALCLQLVHLKNTRNAEVLLPLLAVGTGFANGESEAARSTGRIYIFEIIEVVGEEGLEGRGSFRLKQLFSSADLQDIKAPVTALSQLEGYLVVAQVCARGCVGAWVHFWGCLLHVYENDASTYPGTEPRHDRWEQAVCV